MKSWIPSSTFAFLVTLAFTLVAASAHSESVDVKDVKTDEDSTTTIEIKKGKKEATPAAAAAAAAKWTVEDGSAEIEGEPSPTAKDARAAWKKSCDDWKKEFRADNKDNKVLNMNCGTASCGGDAGSKTCTSKATYKIKTRVD